MRQIYIAGGCIFSFWQISPSSLFCLISHWCYFSTADSEGVAPLGPTMQATFFFLLHLFHLREASARQQQQEQRGYSLKHDCITFCPLLIILLIELFSLHSGMTGRYLEASHSLKYTSSSSSSGGGRC